MGASQSSTQAPASTAAPTTAVPSVEAPVLAECGSCNGGLVSNGVCYPESQAFCDLYPQYTWCGAGAASSTEAPSSSSVPSSSSEPATEAPSSSSSTAAPTTAAPSTEAPSSSSSTEAPSTECGSCSGCLANNGVCYAESKGFCDLYPQYKWCGERRLSSHGHLRR